MSKDEQAIRRLVSEWHRATAAGDIDTVLGLMSADVVFLVPGQPPMTGRDAFAKSLRDLLQTHRIESSGDIHEIQISGDLAYCWSILRVRVMPLAGDEAKELAGNAVSLLRRQASGEWLVTRDANLLVAR
jgi:uncharacterized protein (TIGR02246 family)